VLKDFGGDLADFGYDAAFERAVAMGQVHADFGHDRARGSDSTMIRSDISTASARSWVIRSVVLPVSAIVPAKLFCSKSLVWASSAENGSSSRMISGSMASVRASAARCRMPPES
jgi:hypothetical protein